MTTHKVALLAGDGIGPEIMDEAIKVLHPQDEVGVLVYGSTGEQWLFELTPAREYASLAKKINGAVIGDMPSECRIDHSTDCKNEQLESSRQVWPSGSV